MFEQYKDFLEIVYAGMILSLAVALVLRGIFNNHFSRSIIEDDPEPEPEAEIFILEDHRNKKNNTVKNHITIFGENSGLYKNKNM